MARVHTVNFIPQFNANTCWFACMQMLAEYELSTGTARNPILLKRFLNITLDQLASQRMDGAADDGLIRRQSRLLGMRIATLDATYTGGNAFLGTGGVALGGLDLRMLTMENLLDSRPFGLPCRAVSGGRAGMHVIVVRGYSDEDGSGPEPIKYWYLDPAAEPGTSGAAALRYEDLIRNFVPDGGYVFTF